jgi:UDP-N-acetylmuramate dehydrogenase
VEYFTGPLIQGGGLESKAWDLRISDVTETIAARTNVPLAGFTTFAIGGPADSLLEVRSPEAAIEACARLRADCAGLTFLGGGSNVLVSDLGVRGTVLRFHGGAISRPAGDVVRVDAGVTVNGLVRWCIGHGLGGFEAWAGTPGTLGGAVYGNAHFQGRLMSEVVSRACLLDRSGDVHVEPAERLGFGYDVSRLQATGEALLWVEIRVHDADPARLRTIAKESLTFRKRTQPLALPSAGCIFQNPEAERHLLPEGVPCSAGALIDRVGLKGERRGGARISPVHANFFVNEGGATAAEVSALIEEAKHRVKDAFGIELREEIVRLGEFERERGRV